MMRLAANKVNSKGTPSGRNSLDASLYLILIPGQPISVHGQSDTPAARLYLCNSGGLGDGLMGSREANLRKVFCGGFVSIQS